MISFKKRMQIFEGFLNEAFGERPELDEEMAKFFPTVWNMIKGKFESLLPVLTSVDSNETNLIKSKVKNLNVTVRLNSSTSKIRTYTYPASNDVMMNSIANLFRGFGLFYFLFNGYEFMSKYGKILIEQTKVDSNGIIIFPAVMKNVEFLIFESKGIVQFLEPEERIAIMLHEIGHWANIDKYVKKLSSQVAIIFLPIFTIVFAVCMIIFARSSTWKSDEFASKCGYGPQLSSALKKMGYTVRPNVTIITKILDFLMKINMYAYNVVDYLIPFQSHPSIYKRTKKLEELSEKEKHKINKLVMLCKPLDKIMSKILSKIM